MILKIVSICLIVSNLIDVGKTNILLAELWTKSYALIPKINGFEIPPQARLGQLVFRG